MKKILIVALLAVFAACQNQASVTSAFPIQEVEALVVGDKLPMDGCGAHLVLNLIDKSSDSRTYMRLPTEATRPLMDNLVKAEVARQPAGTLWMGSKEVVIQYREVDQTTALTCGWGRKQEVKTIELLTIKAR